MVEIIRESTEAPVNIIKVKSHIGIVGNEMADELAKEAARTDMETGEDSCTPTQLGADIQADTVEYQHPGSNRDDMSWPVHVWQETKQGPGGTAPQHIHRSRALNNLGPDLRRHTAAKLNLGMANTQTVYFASWQATEADRDECRYHMMHTTDITHAERATALRYRTGTMYTAKQRYRYKQTDSPTCVLCGAVDGGHHTAAGCKHLTRLYIHRHNKAGRAILRAVADGKQGAHLVMADFGKHREEDTEEGSGPGSDPAAPRPDDRDSQNKGVDTRAG